MWVSVLVLYGWAQISSEPDGAFCFHHFGAFLFLFSSLLAWISKHKNWGFHQLPVFPNFPPSSHPGQQNWDPQVCAWVWDGVTGAVTVINPVNLPLIRQIFRWDHCQWNIIDLLPFFKYCVTIYYSFPNPDLVQFFSQHTAVWKPEEFCRDGWQKIHSSKIFSIVWKIFSLMFFI